MLKLQDLTKSYDGVNVLNNISIDIEDGEIISILGPSGSGKTTLLNMILGLVNPDSGRILYNNTDITNIPM